MPTSRRRCRGTTLIEPLVATAVAGVLAAVALPQFVALGDDARRLAVVGVAAAATTAMHANQGACLVADQTPRAGGCVPIDDCAAVARLFVGGLPADYAVAARAVGGPGRNGETAACAVVDTATGSAATFTAISSGL